MAAVENSTRVSDQSSVSMTSSSGYDPSAREHGAIIAREPTRKRIADKDCILKHLGIGHKKSQVQPFSKPNNKVSSLSEGGNESANGESIQIGTMSVPIMSMSHPKQPKPTPARNSDQKKDCTLLSTSSSSTSETKPRSRQLSQTNQFSEESYQQDDELFNADCTRMSEEYSLPTSFAKYELSRPRKSTFIHNSLKHGEGSRYDNLKKNKSYAGIQPFDICPFGSEMFEVNRYKTEDIVPFGSPIDMEVKVEVTLVSQLTGGPTQKMLRPGMILLKGYISHVEQVLLIRKCRELGLGPGGFYRPGYNGRAKLRLLMMCLGLDWDPQTRKYQKRRQVDGSKSPDIPREFHLLVDRAMKDSHALISKDYKVHNAEEILPPISPDICIVNFYSETGRLGLHQDRDESAESLSKGLPVVSFSVGDSADFLYGDQRDPNKAEKILLESGDILIFGGESRHVFHGVSSIIPNSAPHCLLEETGFRSGRLNLTFRQY